MAGNLALFGAWRIMPALHDEIKPKICPRSLWINLWTIQKKISCPTDFQRKITICLKNRHKYKNDLNQIISVIQDQKFRKMPSFLKIISQFSSFLLSCAKPVPIRQFIQYFRKGVHRGHLVIIIDAKDGLFTCDDAFSPARWGCQMAIVHDDRTVMQGRPAR